MRGQCANYPGSGWFPSRAYALSYGYSPDDGLGHLWQNRKKSMSLKGVEVAVQTMHLRLNLIWTRFTWPSLQLACTAPSRFAVLWQPRGISLAPLQQVYDLLAPPFRFLGRHLISQFNTIDGNFKANQFFKRDDGSDIALTDGEMYFPLQAEFEAIARTYVIAEEDKGQVKYVNTAVSGVIACACDHTVAGSFVDMINGEAFALGTVAQREQARHTNSPLHGPATATPTVFSYDSWCGVFRVQVTFPRGDGGDALWAFLNPFGSSTRQMTGAARHDIINFVIDAWNTLKVLRQAELLAEERLDALRLFELHMTVVEDLSRQHAAEVVQSSLSTMTTMLAEEEQKSTRENGHEARTPVAKWIHDGMSIERQQVFIIALLKNHREHPLQETWAKLRDTLNVNLKTFRESQRGIYPRLKLSALDADEPELTAIQLPSYRMKHGQQTRNLREAEIELRCSEATSGILAVRAASLALSAVNKARDLDYRGQAGITRSQSNVQKAHLMKMFEITMYNRARGALVYLGYIAKDAEEPYAPLSVRNTRRKETHLHRAKGDSRLFDGTAWYLQSGTTISHAAVTPILSPPSGKHADESRK
ncbi:hypothetical protein B0H11DRAFT_1905115 [Mycena galericulata]|nr:hypothetical protein B0H11DRAFT_1905115 [Mycena galericulata]